MMYDLKTRKQLIREGYLKRESELYAQMQGADFTKVKDWDHTGPTVSWRGTIKAPDLKNVYTIEVHYDEEYPFIRPKVFPVEAILPDGSTQIIKNNRHQNPSKLGSDKPGDLCLLPNTPDYWVVGTTCKDIIELTKKWFRKYEEGTLGEEFAPPEIERYFPTGSILGKPTLLLAKSLLDVEGKDRVCYILIPTKSDNYAFLATTLVEEEKERVVEEIVRLKQVILPSEVLATENITTGLGFHIDGEPFPVPLDISDLFKFIGSHAMGKREKVQYIVDEIVRRRSKIIATWYKTPFSEIHWLVFQINLNIPSKNGFRPQNYHKKVLMANRGETIKLFSSQQHLCPETIFKRVNGFSVDTMLTKSVALLGCGAIGSRVAETMIMSGLGNITLVDNDELKVGNVSRHVLGLDSIGKNKAQALKEALLKKNPFANIEAEDSAFNVVNNPERLEKILDKSDLVISCIARDSIEFFINMASLEKRKPVIYCRSHLQGRLGVILFCDGNQGPCFQCTIHFLGREDCKIPKIPEIPYEQLVKFDSDCGSAFIPASAVDLDLISLHCARIGLAFFERKPFKGNYWYIRGREFNEDEYPQLNVQVRQPYGVYEYSIPKNPNCPICSGENR